MKFTCTNGDSYVNRWIYVGSDVDMAYTCRDESDMFTVIHELKPEVQ